MFVRIVAILAFSLVIIPDSTLASESDKEQYVSPLSGRQSPATGAKKLHFPGSYSNSTITGSIVVAVSLQQFKACKAKCKKKYHCETIKNLRGGMKTAEKTKCIKKRSACISACKK